MTAITWQKEELRAQIGAVMATRVERWSLDEARQKYLKLHRAYTYNLSLPELKVMLQAMESYREENT